MGAPVSLGGLHGDSVAKNLFLSSGGEWQDGIFFGNAACPMVPPGGVPRAGSLLQGSLGSSHGLPAGLRTPALSRCNLPTSGCQLASCKHH